MLVSGEALLESVNESTKCACLVQQLGSSTFADEHRIRLPPKSKQINHKNDGRTLQRTEKGRPRGFQEEDPLQNKLCNSYYNEQQ